MKKCLLFLLFCASGTLISADLTRDGYFEEPGLTFLVFHNDYAEGHQGGLEIIQHDERIVTNGNVQLSVTPGQWTPYPVMQERQVFADENRISISGTFPDLGIAYSIHITSEREGFHIQLDLKDPLPLHWVGRIGFNIELFPPAFFGKTWQMDETSGYFPRQAGGPVKLTAADNIQPLPIAVGRHLTVAPEDEIHKISFRSLTSDLALYDGRIPESNGWFIVRSNIPAGATKGAVEWFIRPHIQSNYQRSPQILYSQCGYHPLQEKKALIELDPSAQGFERAMLKKLGTDGKEHIVFVKPVKKQSRFLRYLYASFDFTPVKTPGMYCIEYGKTKSPYFRIGEYDHSELWRHTLTTFLPVQMCHMEVRDRFRVWHGVCHLDDALQAPTDHKHFGFYQQGSQTQTSYKPYEHIPGLNTGGWHSAGDYDLSAYSQSLTVYTLSLVQETFAPDMDEVTVLPEDRYVRAASSRPPTGFNSAN
ncbi:MAG: hypothetical protein U5R06_15635 [candidate division KSB1 bacterium]|nr:hypothetical protein [candidate division KSB1 bacterium]